MQRWKLTIEYDGNDFFGWQAQAEGKTVQQTIEKAAFDFSGEHIRIHVAGRTDSGVHALGQVAHIDFSKDYTDTEVRNALNVYMRPHKVAILKAEPVSQEFHARFGAQKRYYRYVMLNRIAPTAIGRDYLWHVHRPLDIEKMRRAAVHFLGTHDFSSFRATECQAKSPIRSLDVFSITTEDERIYFDIEGKSFLHHQVRNMIGTLKRIGDGSWEPDIVLDMLAAKDRRAGGPTAPAQGLFFVKVDYDDTGSK